MEPSPLPDRSEAKPHSDPKELSSTGEGQGHNRGRLLQLDASGLWQNATARSDESGLYLANRIGHGRFPTQQLSS